MCMLGTFSERATISQHSVVKVDDWLPLETAVLVGCGVPSGWGTAVNAGNVRAGDTVVIYGIGGLGINAVQGAVARRLQVRRGGRPGRSQARDRTEVRCDPCVCRRGRALPRRSTS